MALVTVSSLFGKDETSHATPLRKKKFDLATKFFDRATRIDQR